MSFNVPLMSPPVLARCRPAADFDVETDRLLIHTMWDQMVVLAWSSPNPNVGGFMLDPDMMPASIKRQVDRFRLLEPVDAGSDEHLMQPQLLAHQDDTNNLWIELSHPNYVWNLTILHEIGVVESADLSRAFSVYARAASGLAVRGGGEPIERMTIGS